MAFHNLDLGHILKDPMVNQCLLKVHIQNAQTSVVLQSECKSLLQIRDDRR